MTLDTNVAQHRNEKKHRFDLALSAELSFIDCLSKYLKLDGNVVRPVRREIFF